MMAIVVILFILCWTPIQVFNIVIWLYSDSLITQTKNEMDLYVGSFFVSHWLAMSHSCGQKNENSNKKSHLIKFFCLFSTTVNPIVYCFMSDNFRVSLNKIFFCYYLIE
jgi:hypothetical protein